MSESSEASEDWGAHGDAVPQEHEVWPLRPVLLAALGLAAGLAVYFLLGDEPFYMRAPTPLMLSLAAAVTVSAGLIGFTIERRLWWASILFSLAMGVLAGAVIWWSGGPDSTDGDGLRTFSLFLGIAIAAPLFQAARDASVFEGAPRFPYAGVHDHAWINVVLWGACWAFVGIVFALAHLLAELFHLIKIDVLRDLLRENWAWHALVGLAFGGAVGLLREHDRVVRLLQRVVAMVLAVLAPVLAVGLILFVLALPFTGLSALWDATSATTPLLLGCCVGALILANAVIGNAPEEERTFPVLKYGAMGLGLVMLPLAVIAAIATGLRIGQYGFTPDRLWGLTFVVIACAYGLAYLVSLLVGRLHWAERARPANLHLAFGLCAVALVLATPLISFNAISTRDQVARLESGKIRPDKFDWAALRYQFGQAGRDALEKLKRSPNAAIRHNVELYLAGETQGAELKVEEISFEMNPAGTPLSEALKTAAKEQCYMQTVCRIFLQPDKRTAVVVNDGCSKLTAQQQADPAFKCHRYLNTLILVGDKWQPPQPELDKMLTEEKERASLSSERDAFLRGDVTVRKVERRQVFVGDKPHGQTFD